MTRIDIFSGFLGAGKTTLIKKLLKESLSGEQVVLIENEFGEIGIDGGFMKEAGIQVTEMNSGCICCSLVGDFGEALRKVIAQYHPDRILIEPSGVGKLSDVIRAVEGVEKDIEEAEMGSFVTVADALKCRMYIKNFGEFFLNQIEAAGTVVLSRTQNVTDEKLSEAVAKIREHNAEARIITTAWDDITGQQILEAMEHSTNVEDIMKNFKYDPDEEDEHEHHHHHHDHDDDDDEHENHHHHDDDDDEHEHHHHHHDHDEDEEHEHHHHHHEEDEGEGHHHHHYDENGVCSCGHHHHHHHGHDADEVFTSWGKETEKRFDREDLQKILEQLAVEEENPYGIILRAKGIVPDKNRKWLEFDLVPGEFEIRNGGADYTGKLCVIGSQLKEDKLAELFGIQ